MRGTTMFRFFKSSNSQQPDQLPGHYLDYIHTSIKPYKDVFDGFQAKVETELKDNIDDMRQEFKHLVDRIKARHNR